MAKSLRDLVTGLKAFEESVATIAPRRIAERVTAELQDAGPAWSGTFRNAWRILPGDQSPSPTIEGPGTYEPGDTPNPIPVVRQTVPSLGFGKRFTATLTKAKTLYTITNLAKHRLTAMDLQPNPRQVPRTAPRDWLATYLQGGQLDSTVRTVLDAEIGKRL